jgi:hypothetical protein
MSYARTSPPAIRSARARRVRSIRRWALAGAATLFVTVWLLIAVVLVSGHDPALSKSSSSSASNQSGNALVQSSTGGSSGSTGSSSNNVAPSSGGSVVTRSS